VPVERNVSAVLGGWQVGFTTVWARAAMTRRSVQEVPPGQRRPCWSMRPMPRVREGAYGRSASDPAGCGCEPTAGALAKMPRPYEYKEM
jgi:hypothetical protein